MLHKEKHAKGPAYVFQYLLKSFSMFNIMLWYDENIFHRQDPDNLVIMYINGGKTLVVRYTINQ